MNFVKDISPEANFGAVTPQPVTGNLILNPESANSGPFVNLKIDTILWLIIIFIVIGLIIYCLCKNHFGNKNENITNKEKKSVKFKEYDFGDDLIMICNDSCPYSNKMKEDLISTNHMIKDKKVKFIQYNSDKGNTLRNTHGILGTPALINFKNNKPLAIILGYTPLDDLIKKLDGSSEEPNSDNKVDELLLIGNDMCGFCKKQKDLYDSKNIKYRFVDSNSPEGMNFMKKHNSNGVPLLINIVDGKEIPNIGYSESFP